LRSKWAAGPFSTQAFRQIPVGRFSDFSTLNRPLQEAAMNERLTWGILGTQSIAKNMYRCHPQTKMLRQLLGERAVAQSFPTFALFGPRQLSEVRSTFPGMAIELEPAENSMA
jgi:hypothetical protein